ncbi:hypothetical protein KP509_27G029900 [Ceratopteris richardii]|uniref:Nitrate regulatory gene2 protein n=1 Tax=Ceratopteris richardii TaxID=49495 RepID=A0A8T2RGF2_CERRI|nr:hypothetical protein KP509_27G029900 [Ceratopteris richardii]
MGCVISKLKAEDVVGRCKARKRLMKKAVQQRLAFAAAHAAYIASLRSVGAALRQFAEEEGGLPAREQGNLECIPEPPPPPPLMDDPSLSPGTNLDTSLAKRLEFTFIESDVVSSQGQVLESKTSEHTVDTSSLSIEVEDFSTPPVPNAKAHKRNVSVATTTAEIDVADNSQGRGNSARHLPVHRENTAANVDDIGKCSPASYDHDGYTDNDLSLILKLNAKKDLPQIIREIDEEFLEASAGGVDVTRTLEIYGSQAAHAGFSKGTTHRSARVFSVLSWNWSRSPVRRSGGELESQQKDSDSGKKSHALTLERLLAWEKKLVEEVKVVNALRDEQVKKCSILRRQETKGDDATEIEKTRVELKRLHSLLLVANHAVESTVEAIEDLRDEELHPQLVELIGGLMNMWISMHRSHAKQTHIIVHIKNIDAMLCQEPTSEAHHQTTLLLEKELLGWHESFCKLVSSQRAYMSALYGWLKLTLIPIPTGRDKIEVDGDRYDQGRDDLDTCRLCEEWQRALGCLPDRVASEAIKSLAEVVKAVVAKQGEEMKQKKKADKLEKHWKRKMCALQPLEVEENATVGGRREKTRTKGEDDDGLSSDSSNFGMAERKAALAALRKKVEGEMMKHVKAVQDTRVLTMNNLQTGLPGVLEAMTGFSAVCSQAFQHLHSLTLSLHL